MVHISVFIANERQDVFAPGSDPTTVERQLQCLVPEFARADAEVQAKFWYSTNPWSNGERNKNDAIELGMQADLFIVFLSSDLMASDFYSQRLRQFIQSKKDGLLLFVLRPCLTMGVEDRLQLNGQVIKKDKDWQRVRELIVNEIRHTKPTQRKEVVPMTHQHHSSNGGNRGNGGGSAPNNDDLRRMAEQKNQQASGERQELSAYENVAEVKRISDRAESALFEACSRGQFYAEVMEVNYHGHLTSEAARGHDMRHLENLTTLGRDPLDLFQGVAMGVWRVLTEQRGRQLRLSFYHDPSESRMGRRCKIIIYV